MLTLQAMQALRNIFEMHGLAIAATFGSGYYPAAGRAGTWLARHPTRHAHFIGVVARRVPG